MEHIRLYALDNQYPQISNYTATGVNTSALYGLYPETNKIDFKLENLNNVTSVPDTKFRFILAIKNGASDTNLRYFTSPSYYSDLEASIIDANPYFNNLSFDSSFIVTYDVAESIAAFKNQKSKEHLINIQLKRNNFLTTNEFVLSNEANVKKAEQTLSTQNSDTLSDGIKRIDAKITLLQNEIVNNDFFKPVNTFTSETNIGDYKFKSRKNGLFNRSAQLEDIKNQISDEIENLKKNKENLQNQLNDTLSKVNTISLSTKHNELFNNFGGEVSIDYIKLVQYIDWVLTLPNLNELANSGVLPSETLIEYNSTGSIQTTSTGDVIDKSNPSDTGIKNVNGANVFVYELIRLAIPAKFEDSLMTYRDENGIVQNIQQSDYGIVKDINAMENSWGNNHQLYQKTLLRPYVDASMNGNTGIGGGIGNNSTSGPGGGGGGRQYQSDVMDGSIRPTFTNQIPLE
jgi:hypothetical protein